MRFACLHAFVSYLLAGVGFLALSLGDELGLGSRVFFALGWLASLFVSDARRARPRYQTIWNGVLVAYLATAVLRLAFLGVSGLSPLYLFYSIGFTFAVLLVGVLIFNRVESTFMDTV